MIVVFLRANKSKDVKIILQISKEVTHKLNAMGVKFGENGISKTHSGHDKYYLTESRVNLKLLEKIAKAK
jgi:hypothetical protein